jgi:hypothetical protein
MSAYREAVDVSPAPAHCAGVRVGSGTLGKSSCRVPGFWRSLAIENYSTWTCNCGMAWTLEIAFPWARWKMNR